MEQPIPDPWAVVTSASARPVRRVTRWAGVALAALIGLSGPFVALVFDGAQGRQGAAVLVCVAVSTAILVRLGDGGRWRLAAAGLAVVLAAGELIATGLVGRAPVLVTMAGVLVADATLFGWEVFRRPGASEATGPAPAGLAIPVLVAAEVVWARSERNAWVMSMLAVSLLIAVLSHREVAPVAGLGRILQRGLMRLANLVGTVVLLIVAVPTLYVPGLLARAVGWVSGAGRRRGDLASNWQERPAPARSDAEARHPFADVPRSVRWRRNAVGVGVVTSVVVATWVGTRAPEVVDKGREPLAVSTPADVTDGVRRALLEEIERVPYSERPAYEGVPFADELQQELATFPLVDGPVGGYGIGDFRGTYTNATGGVRHSLVASCECPRVAAWFAGGSAAFGMGQRDEHTIPSEWVRLAEADGIALDVDNLGVPGWTLWQEYQGVLARLAFAGERPDLVVFFDGYNDTVGTIVNSVVGDPDPERPAVLDPGEVQAYVDGLDEDDRPLDGEALGRLTAQRYEALRRVIEEHLGGLGIAVEFFFQPDAFATPVQREPIEDLYRPLPMLHRLSSLDVALRTAASALSPDVHDLRHVLDDELRPVFADTVHTNEPGAAVVASAIHDVMSERLRELAR